MDQFDDARIRAAKLEVKRRRYQPISAESEQMRRSLIAQEVEAIASEVTCIRAPVAAPIQLPKAPKVKAPVKRTNEIAIRVYVDGEEMDFTVRVNFNDIIASQRTRPNIKELFSSMFRWKFGKVAIE